MGKHFALPPAKSRTGRRVLVLVLIAALTVALLVLSGIGRAIAMNILIPLFGPGDDNEDDAQHKIACPRLDIYLLQLAVDTDAKKAAAAAQAIAGRGGAGYVLRDKEEYRVLASGYLTRDEAQSVADKQEEYSPALIMLSSGSLSFSARCTAKQAETLSQACRYYPALARELLEEAQSLDRRELTAAGIRVKYTYRAVKTQEMISGLEALPASKDNALISELLTLYRNLYIYLNEISEKNDKLGLDFCSEIKYNYIEMAVAYRDMICRLS